MNMFVTQQMAGKLVCSTLAVGFGWVLLLNQMGGRHHLNLGDIRIADATHVRLALLTAEDIWFGRYIHEAK